MSSLFVSKSFHPVNERFVSYASVSTQHADLSSSVKSDRPHGKCFAHNSFPPRPSFHSKSLDASNSEGFHV